MELGKEELACEQDLGIIGVLRRRKGTRVFQR